MIVSCLSQKGGAGKSTLARAIAVEFARNGWQVHIADLDRQQQSCFKWFGRREEKGLQPLVEVSVASSVNAAMKVVGQVDLLVIDGAPHATSHTKQAAEVSDLIVIPTGVSIDDLEPALGLAQELSMNGVSRSKILFVVTKVPGSHKELMSTKSSIKDWGFAVADSAIPFSTGYSLAQDGGRTLSETRHASLNEKADRVVQSIADCVMEKNNG